MKQAIKSKEILIALGVGILLLLLSTAMGTVVETLDIGEAGDDADPTTAARAVFPASIYGTYTAYSGPCWTAAEMAHGRSARKKNGATLDAFTLTIPSTGIGTLYVTYYDDSALSTGGANLRLWLTHNDGGTWEDELLGALPFDGIDEWRRIGLPFPDDIYNAYADNIACMDDPGQGDAWPADYSSAAGWQAFFQISQSPGFSDPTFEAYFDKIEIDDAKTWTFDLGTNAGENYGDRDPMYILPSDIDDGKWSAITTIDGETCRLTVADFDAPFTMAFTDDILTLSIMVYDDDPSEAPGVSLWADYQDGDTWRDLFIGNIHLDGTGGWETKSFAVPAALYTDGGDANESQWDLDCGPTFNRPGHQVTLRIWDYDPLAGSGDPAEFGGSLAISEVTVTDQAPPSPSPTPTPSPPPTFTEVDPDVWSEFYLY